MSKGLDGLRWFPRSAWESACSDASRQSGRRRASQPAAFPRGAWERVNLLCYGSPRKFKGSTFHTRAQRFHFLQQRGDLFVADLVVHVDAADAGQPGIARLVDQPANRLANLRRACDARSRRGCSGCSKTCRAAIAAAGRRRRPSRRRENRDAAAGRRRRRNGAGPCRNNGCRTAAAGGSNRRPAASGIARNRPVETIVSEHSECRIHRRAEAADGAVRR